MRKDEVKPPKRLFKSRERDYTPDLRDVPITTVRQALADGSLDLTTYQWPCVTICIDMDAWKNRMVKVEWLAIDVKERPDYLQWVQSDLHGEEHAQLRFEQGGIMLLAQLRSGDDKPISHPWTTWILRDNRPVGKAFTLGDLVPRKYPVGE